jgi:hypothetical protein
VEAASAFLPISGGATRYEGETGEEGEMRDQRV